MARGAKKAQAKILQEIKNQLVLQAERWGKKDHYTPLKLEDLELEQCRKIKGDLLAERSNLDYELHMLDTDKRELLIKLEKLEVYLKRADHVIGRHEKNMSKMIDKSIGDRKKIRNAERLYKKGSAISVLVGS